MTALVPLLAVFFAYVLGKRQAEHQVRATRTYDERARVVADLYKRVVETETNLKQYAFPFGTGSQEQREVAAARFTELWNCYHANSIWLNRRACDTLESFLDEASQLFSDMHALTDSNLTRREFNLPEDASARRELRNATARRAVAEIPAIRKQLRDEFKELLKVVDPSPGHARARWRFWQRRKMMP